MLIYYYWVGQDVIGFFWLDIIIFIKQYIVNFVRLSLDTFPKTLWLLTEKCSLFFAMKQCQKLFLSSSGVKVLPFKAFCKEQTKFNEYCNTSHTSYNNCWWLITLVSMWSCYRIHIVLASSLSIRLANWTSLGVIVTRLGWKINNP